MKNFKHSGLMVAVVAAVGGIQSGQGVLAGDLFGVAATTVAEGEPVNIQVQGVFALPKEGDSWAQGAKLWWDPALGALKPAAAAGRKLVAIAESAATVAETTARVRLTGQALPDESGEAAAAQAAADAAQADATQAIADAAAAQADATQAIADAAAAQADATQAIADAAAADATADNAQATANAASTAAANAQAAAAAAANVLLNPPHSYQLMHDADPTLAGKALYVELTPAGGKVLYEGAPGDPPLLCAPIAGNDGVVAYYDSAANTKGTRLYVNESAALGARLITVSPLALPIELPTLSGRLLTVAHDANAAANGVGLYVDPAQALSDRLRFTSPTVTNSSEVTSAVRSAGYEKAA